MSDPIGRPAGARGREEGGIDTERPDASFHDDQVGARVKSDEAARARQAANRYIKPKFVETEKKVGQTERFRPAHKESGADALERDARRQAALRSQAVPGRRIPRGPRPQNQSVLRDQERAEQRLELLLDNMSRLYTLLNQGDEAALEAESLQEAGRWDDRYAVDEDGEQPSSDPGTHDEHEDADDEADNQAASHSDKLVLRLSRLEQAAKFQFQLLVGSGNLTLMADPLLTFKRLFDRIGTWPQMVRPGHRPATEADIDVFLGWVFEPSDDWQLLTAEQGHSPVK